MSTEKFRFDLNSQYDLNTYTGRLFHFMKITDIRNFFVTRYQLQQHIEYLSQHKTKISMDATDYDSDKLWNSKYIVDGCVNSNTKEIIPKLFRMNSYGIVNIPLLFLLICIPATSFNLMASNFVNQTYNACLNYFNGSASGLTKALMISYFLAIGSSMGSALLFKSLLGDPSGSIIKSTITRIMPSCIAGFLNLAFMRSNYITDGLAFTDSNNNYIGLSRRIGLKAIIEGGLSRLLIPVPLVLNFVIMNRIHSLSLSTFVSKIIEITLCSMLLYFGLPFTIAVFNQNGSFPVSKLEEEHLNKLKEGKYFDEYVYYNKGL